MVQLSEEKRDLIFKRLREDCTIRDIAEELQISEKTVKRYKQSMKTALESRARVHKSDEVEVDYSKLLTKKEKQHVEKIQKELLLYEDAEEGWIYHLSKSDLRVRQSGCWWSAIVYPDSAPDGWIESLRAQGFRIAISPLHDSDVWMHDSKEVVDPETGEIIKQKGELYKIGDKKKAHWHVIIVVDKRCSFVEMNYTMQKLTHCPLIQKCRSLRNAYDYFLHINAPEKCQTYKKEDIQTYNNFHLEPNNYEKNLIAMEMVRLIQEHDLCEWCEVVEFFQNDPEFSLILSSRTAYFAAYVKSKYYKKHPNSIKYTEIKHVNRFSFEEESENESESE